VLNGQDSSVDYNDEIYVSDAQSTDAVLINNVALPSSGRAALGGESVSNDSNNVWLAAGAASPFVSTENPLDFLPATSSTQLIDQGTSSSAPSEDIGFDPQCITTASGLGQWWQYAPDYAYIESVGGVAGCFRRGTRPVGSAVDIGAYESGSAATGCTDDAQCDDGDVCTTDTCQASGQCSNLAVAGCCTTDADCADADDCTIDTCDTATNVCSNVVDPECGQNNSGEWSVDANGYVSVCDWGGYHWGAAGPEEPGVNGTLSSIEETAELCYSGVVAAHDGYRGWALAGVNISQEPGAGTTAENTTPIAP
jgi:hypothetical protein